MNFSYITSAAAFSICFFDTGIADTRDYYLGDDFWSINLILENCREDLEVAVKTVLNEHSADDKQFAAVLPEKIGERFFSVVFKTVEKNIVLPLNKFTFEFEYWQRQTEGKIICERIEPHDYIY